MAKRKSKQQTKIITAILSIIVFVLFSYIVKDYDSKKESFCVSDYSFSVSFIDVGQGDCELIYCNGKSVLVDGGEAVYSSTVVKYLSDNSISSVDYYILTHPHSDHIGAAAGIINSIKCEYVVMTDFSDDNMPTTNVFERTLDAIDENECKLVTVEAGDNIEVGEMKLQILSPQTQTSDYNDMSIVFKAVYRNTSVLFTGDATKTIENELLTDNIDVSADVLKVAHHGSKTSNSKDFISAVASDIAVISCGSNNQYSHPHKEVLNTLQKDDIEVYRTDISGTVVYYGDGIDMTLRVTEE